MDSSNVLRTILIIFGFIVASVGLVMIIGEAFYKYRKPNQNNTNATNYIQEAEVEISGVKAKAKLKMELMMIVIGAAIGFFGLYFLPVNKELSPIFQKNNLPNIFSGSVVEEGTNESISDAEIFVVEQTEKYYSKERGNFRIIIRDTSLHQIEIKVVKSGFEPFDDSYDIPDQDATITLKKK